MEKLLDDMKVFILEISILLLTFTDIEYKYCLSKIKDVWQA